MDDMKDRSIHFTAQKLSDDIQNMNLYKNFYADLQVSMKIKKFPHSKTNHP